MSQEDFSTTALIDRLLLFPNISEKMYIQLFCDSSKTWDKNFSLLNRGYYTIALDQNLLNIDENNKSGNNISSFVHFNVKLGRGKFFKKYLLVNIFIIPWNNEFILWRYFFSEEDNFTSSLNENFSNLFRLFESI